MSQTEVNEKLVGKWQIVNLEQRGVIWKIVVPMEERNLE